MRIGACRDCDRHIVASDAIDDLGPNIRVLLEIAVVFRRKWLGGFPEDLGVAKDQGSKLEERLKQIQEWLGQLLG